MNFLDNYLCDVHDSSQRIYTSTSNKLLLDKFNIKNPEGELFDFKSKSTIKLNQICRVEPRGTSIHFNPYIEPPVGPQYDIVVQQSLNLGEVYLQLPGDCFTNTKTKHSIDRFSIVFSIIQKSNQHLLDPYFLEVCLSDDGATDYLLNHYDILQKVCMLPLLQELKLTLTELIQSNISKLIADVRGLWIEKLETYRRRLISQIDDRSSQLTKAPNTAFMFNELQHEKLLLEMIDLQSNVNSINFVGDVFRYFPFNSTDSEVVEFYSQFPELSKLKLTPINRWHHKLYIVCSKMFPSSLLTYWDIESNNTILTKKLYTQKMTVINKAKQEIQAVLDLEKSILDNTQTSIQKDIDELQEKITSIPITISDASSISDIVNFWPPVLGVAPVEFVLN